MLAVAEAQFGTATQVLDSVLQYLVWYYTDWNGDFAQVEQSIDDTAWGTGQKAAMKSLVQKGQTGKPNTLPWPFTGCTTRQTQTAGLDCSWQLCVPGQPMHLAAHTG